MSQLRVAFLSDSFHEVNGVALTSRQYEAFARKHQLPFFSLHAGPHRKIERDGTVVIHQIQRSTAAFSLESDSDLSFDLLIWRQKPEVLASLQEFRPDLIHVTGPCDIGMLGASLAHQMRIPLVASWHTNVHEYAGRRLQRLLSFLPDRPRDTVSQAAERGAFRGAARFYQLARLLFAPNQELVDLLRHSTGKPCFLMQRGVEADKFSPAKRTPGQRPFTIGYVGRLSVEKNVRFLAEIEKGLIASGKSDYRFLVIGPGNEEGWLRQNLRRAEFAGVLKGEELARAYADMDVFVFPSFTDTFGNVILEALASGVPAVVTTGGGPKFLVRSGETGFVAADDSAFIRCVQDLMNDPELRTNMSRAAREYACSISWDRVFQNVWNTYKSVLFNRERAAS